MPRTPPLARYAVTLALAGCATASPSTVSAVALDDTRIYVVDAQTVRVLADDGRDLRPRDPLALPCPAPRDLEHHRGALHLLCADGRVFASRDPTSDAWQLLLPALTNGIATALQRADGQLVQVTRHEPPPQRGLHFDGPPPSYSGRPITREYSEPANQPLNNYWHGTDELSPAAADAGGRAFIFSTRLVRRTQFVISAEGSDNLRCRVRGGHHSLDLAIDDRRRTFASLSSSPSELLIFRLANDGTIRASAHDPQTGAPLRTRLRCVR